MNGSTVTHNAAVSTGGGARVYYATLTIEEGALVEDNVAGSSGAGVSLSGNLGGWGSRHGRVFLAGTVSDNTAVVNGGGLYVLGGILYVNNTGRVLRNAAHGQGGGIVVYAKAVIGR